MNAKPAKDIANSLPPVVTLLSPADGDIFSADSLTVRYTVRSPSGLPVSEVRALRWFGQGSPPPPILVVADILRGLALPPRHFITRLSPQLGVKRPPAEIRSMAACDPSETDALIRHECFAGNY